MLRCSKHGEYSVHTITIRVCPKCGRMLDARESFRHLIELGMSDELIRKIEDEMLTIGLCRRLQQ